jgi:hypothetical protein
MGRVPKDRPPKELLVEILSRQDYKNYPSPHLGTKDAYPPCTKPLAQLRNIKISELKLEWIHHGRYLIAKVVTFPHQNLKTMAVIEDDEGEALIMQLCNQDAEEDRPASSVLGEGMVVVIKEPYFMFLDKACYVLRVDHVSDILCLADCDSRIPNAWKKITLQKSALEWKEEGNELVKPHKRYWDALVR